MDTAVGPKAKTPLGGGSQSFLTGCWPLRGEFSLLTCASRLGSNRKTRILSRPQALLLKNKNLKLKNENET
jgi:hypothetical protein